MRILSICSARPNFVKLAAVHHAIADRDGDEVGHLIVHTGQHYDPLFSDIFFEQLEIPLPDENLDIHGGTREDVIAKTEAACLPVFQKHAPDWVLVYGDVNGALGAAQAAKKAGIKIAHVEAGLRSFDDSMPEEHNRIAIDAIADLLLVSEQSGMDNLKKEKHKGKVELVGNTMIDTLIRMLPHIEHAELPVLPIAGECVETVHFTNFEFHPVTPMKQVSKSSSHEARLSISSSAPSRTRISSPSAETSFHSVSVSAVWARPSNISCSSPSVTAIR
jgi:UDP-N-acetylglucosamine 2-epimerase (non-hydrolysing)